MSTGRNHRRLDKIEQNASGDPETGPWVVFGPKWAQDVEDADPPPEYLSDPVWARGEGWMEKEYALPKAFIWIHGPQELS
jgi:rhamnogalacturonyl hydrolase YesR